MSAQIENVHDGSEEQTSSSDPAVVHIYMGRLLDNTLLFMLRRSILKSKIEGPSHHTGSLVHRLEHKIRTRVDFLFPEINLNRKWALNMQKDRDFLKLTELVCDMKFLLTSCTIFTIKAIDHPQHERSITRCGTSSMRDPKSKG